MSSSLTTSPPAEVVNETPAAAATPWAGPVGLTVQVVGLRLRPRCRRHGFARRDHRQPGRTESFSLVFNLFVQIGLGYDALDTGLVLAPWAFGIAIGATISGAVLAEKLGRQVLHTGIPIASVGMMWLAWTIHPQWHGDHRVGYGLADPVGRCGRWPHLRPAVDIILADVGDEEVGSGAGLLNAVQQFSGAAGAALLGTVFFELVLSSQTDLLDQRMREIGTGCGEHRRSFEMDVTLFVETQCESTPRNVDRVRHLLPRRVERGQIHRTGSGTA
jgi:hypothetical protein